ncbi:hypothetical protein [Paractinoplanes hotanensis]|uniref:Secreted protein n=1 Tax=Paractinoplanes hotanensis TaxID=2906497 RepID=A0ABT0YEG0_9ACTN|nr:hypothetical protein [Actinoplanes hotanensis]MCM4083644.1 hypothetical protein [Actinoplanes hotanensis]
MRTRRSATALAVAGASTTILAVSAAPAAAQTAAGVADNFYGSCDASVYVSDDLTGSPGKVEAWGGYTCPTSFDYVGQLRLTLRDGTATIGTDQKAVNGPTDHVDVTADNVSGVQNWHADLWIFRPGYDPTIVSTGEVRS